MSPRCPACGAPSLKGGRFCRSCGGPLTGHVDGPGNAEQGLPPVAPPPSPIPLSAKAPNGGGPRRSNRAAWWITGTLAVLVVVLAGVVTGMALTRDPGPSDTASVRRSAGPAPDPATTTSAAPPTTTAPEPATTTRPTTAVPPPPPSTTVAPAGVRGTAVRTCGRDGRGYCNVAVRTRPTSDAPEIRHVDEGQPIWVVCQVPGGPAYSSVLDESVAIWVRTHDGLYAANIFVDAPGFDLRSINVPCPD